MSYLFDPPIESRETDELIAIANGGSEEWHPKAIIEAKEELQRRKITKEYQQDFIKQLQAAQMSAALANQKRLERNEEEGYSTLTMIYIFLVAPLLLFGKWSVGLSLRELRQQNFKKKYSQRILLLICGILFWTLFIALDVRNAKKKRLEEIENVDISKWREQYYGKDSIAPADK